MQLVGTAESRKMYLLYNAQKNKTCIDNIYLSTTQSTNLCLQMYLSKHVTKTAVSRVCACMHVCV